MLAMLSTVCSEELRQKTFLQMNPNNENRDNKNRLEQLGSKHVILAKWTSFSTDQTGKRPEVKAQTRYKMIHHQTVNITHSKITAKRNVQRSTEPALLFWTSDRNLTKHNYDSKTKPRCVIRGYNSSFPDSWLGPASIAAIVFVVLQELKFPGKKKNNFRLLGP